LPFTVAAPRQATAVNPSRRRAMTSTEQFEKAASTARTATEKSVEMWKQGAQTFADQAGKLTGLPQVDVTSGVQQYFEMVQRAVDVNRELAEKWAALVTSLTGVAREQVKSVSNVVVEQVEQVGDLATAQAKRAEQLAHEEAERVEAAEKEAVRAAKAEERRIAKEAQEEVERAEAAEKEAVRAAKAEERRIAKEAQEEAERAEAAEKEEIRAAKAEERRIAKEAHDKAREAYQGKTKAELSDLLAERELPKTGNLDELVERLVEADTAK
jgi:hypothetical protein